MNFYDIENYAKIGSILERAEKIRFEVTAIKIRVGADRTEEVRVKDFSDKFGEFLSKSLKDEQKHIKNSLFQIVNGKYNGK